MKWIIPAKTFLLGEYAAIAGSSALVLTTLPCFELSLTSENRLVGIHPESPAGLWWSKKNFQNKGLLWRDPFNGIGGLGASSAQFLGSYLASCFITKEKPKLKKLLNEYYKVSWSGTGLRPSGYDLIAQSQKNCVYINQQNKILKSYSWPFQNLSFFLIHTGIKLATHHHLKNAILPQQIDYLSSLVDRAKQAFEQADANQLIYSVNEYHKELLNLNLVAEHSRTLINKLKEHSEITAIKGCGALGADTLMLLTQKNNKFILANKLKEQNCAILATEDKLYPQKSLIEHSEEIS